MGIAPANQQESAKAPELQPALGYSASVHLSLNPIDPKAWGYVNLALVLELRLLYLVMLSTVLALQSRGQWL